MKNNILIPIDFNEQSAVALEHAKYFADILTCEVHLLHIVEDSKVLAIFSKDTEYQKLTEMVQQLLNAEANKFDAKTKVVTKIKRGKVYQQIEEYIAEIDPIFTLIGKTEKPSLVKRLLGSNTLHLVNEVKNPVISITGTKVIAPTTECPNILVPMDFSKNITEQLTAAIEFAKLLSSNLHLLTIDTTTSVANEASLLIKLNKTKKYIEEQNIVCLSTLISDTKTEVADIINDFAVKSNAHLVVIMTRDQDNFKEFFIGSQARSIIENCQIPVLSVQPWDLADKNSIFATVVDPLNIINN